MNHLRGHHKGWIAAAMFLALVGYVISVGPAAVLQVRQPWTQDGLDDFYLPVRWVATSTGYGNLLFQYQNWCCEVTGTDHDV